MQHMCNANPSQFKPSSVPQNSQQQDRSFMLSFLLVSVTFILMPQAILDYLPINYKFGMYPTDSDLGARSSALKETARFIEVLFERRLQQLESSESVTCAYEMCHLALCPRVSARVYACLRVSGLDSLAGRERPTSNEKPGIDKQMLPRTKTNRRPTR